MLNRQQTRHEKGKMGDLLERKENVNFYPDGLDRGTRMNWVNRFLSRVEVFSSKIVAKGRRTISGTNSCMANKLKMKWLTMTSSHWPTYLTRRERRRSRKRESSFANLRILENIVPISEFWRKKFAWKYFAFSGSKIFGYSQLLEKIGYRSCKILNQISD